MTVLQVKTDREIEIILTEFVESIQSLFAERLIKIILFGSYARGDYDEESDMDLMVLLNEEEEALRKYSDMISNTVVELNLKHDVLLSVILQSENNFYRYVKILPFYHNVKNEGVVLFGE